MREIEVVDAEKQRVRYELAIGDVIGIGSRFYIIAKHGDDTFAVCLNDSAMLKYTEIPLYNDIYRVKTVEKL